MENTYKDTPESLGGEKSPDTTTAPSHRGPSAKSNPDRVIIMPEKLQPSTREKVTAFLSNLDGYDGVPPIAVDTEQAQFLIHHLAQGIESEDLDTQMNRYIDIVKLCIQTKDKELYRTYTEKLRAITDQAEAEAPSVEESNRRINKLIDDSLT